MLRRLIFAVAPLVLLTACATESSDPTGPPSAAGSGSRAGTADASPTASASSAPPRDFQGRWWSWAASEPAASSPVADETGKFCNRKQPSDVWFLAGTFGGHVDRRCTVPVGRPIVAPLVNSYSGEARDCTNFMAHATGSAELDGAKLRAIKVVREKITITGTAGNALGLDAGTWGATGCGLWIHVPPLNAGTHQLKIRGKSGSFTVGVDYTLVVAS